MDKQPQLTWIEILKLILDLTILQIKALIVMVLDIYRYFMPIELKCLENELILVTGSGQNVGRELSIQLCKQGARLILLDINTANNEQTGRDVRAAGGVAHTVTCDISDHSSVVAAAARIRAEVGHPSIVINNAGIYEYKGFLDHSADQITRLINVNLLGTMWVTKEFIGYMKQKNSGQIVFINSVLGYMGRANAVPYCASKFGIKGMTEALTEELRLEKKQGVRLSIVHPFLISNVNDVSVKVRVPWLFEVLEPKEAAKRIIKGIRGFEEEVFLPEKMKPLMFGSRLLPRRIRRLYTDFMES